MTHKALNYFVQQHHAVLWQAQRLAEYREAGYSVYQDSVTVPVGADPRVLEERLKVIRAKTSL